MKIIYNKLFAILITVMCCLAILEIGLRLNGKMTYNMGEGIYEQYYSSYKLKPNMAKDVIWPNRKYSVYTNTNGFRDFRIRNIDLNSHKYEVFIGASEVFGNGLNYEKTFVGIYRKACLKNNQEVINMAVGGHHYLDQFDIYYNFINNIENYPTKVFLCLNAINIPKFDKKNKNLIVKNGNLFEKNNWKMAYVKLFLSNHLSNYIFIRDGIRKFQEKYFAEYSRNDSPEFLNIYSIKNRMHDPDVVDAFYDMLDKFNMFCFNNKIKPIYVYMPIVDAFRLEEYLKKLNFPIIEYDNLYYVNMISKYCKNRNISFINIYPLLYDAHIKGKRLIFKSDPHYNEYANKLIGDYLASVSISNN